ncbi:MAG: hypothetical protein RL556_809 [Actinomycetota bacterium]
MLAALDWFLLANLLYKLGLFSARRAWLVITAWVVILGVAIGSAAAFSGKLSTSMSLDGTPSQLVIDDLKASFPEASRGSGQIIFHKTNGQNFTKAEQAQIVSALNNLTTLGGVDSILDPFKTEADIAKNRADLLDGQKKLAEAPAKLKSAQKKVNQGKKDLVSGQKTITANVKKLKDTLKTLKGQQKQLEAGIAQLQAGHAPNEMVAPYLANLAKLKAGISQVKAGQVQLATAQKKLNAGKIKLAKAQKKIDKAWADITVNTPKLATAQKILDAANGFVTVSKDGQTAAAGVYFKHPLNEIEEPQKSAVVDSISSVKIANVQVEVSQELTRSMPSLLGPGEMVGLVVAAIVLFLILGTLIAAGLPVLSALIGVGISASATMALSSVLQMTQTTPILGIMLGLAVGIDYSLFIINRHRRQLKMGVEVGESIGLANGTSGNAVVFAGITVIIALVALNLTGVGFLGLMGSVGAAAIAIAVLVAITFTPAVVSLIGLKVITKKDRAKIGDAAAQHNAEQPKNATKPVFATRHPWVSIVATITLLLIAAQPISSLRLGLPDGSSESIESTQYKAFKLASSAFGVGINGPIVVIATSDTVLEDQLKLDFEAAVATRLMQLKNVAAAVPAKVSPDGKKVLFEVIPKTGPASAETEQLVYDVRGLDAETQRTVHASLGVTGFTASNIDLSKKLADALPLYLGTVLILSMILLVLVFRSIAVPVIASAGFLLTVFAVLGSEVAVFQWGWLGSLFQVHDPGPIMSFVPTIIIGVVFGLAMDYQLFLVSGMREAYVHGHSPKDSINFGIHLSRAVVVAAAIIMVSVFGGFAFSDMVTIRPIGFGLATGVLFDAFLVRLILVPATMTILGKGAWYIPKWLDRILPNVDVEGAALERQHLH